MLSSLTPKQRELANVMSNISEKCYSAGWIDNLEFILWKALINGEQKIGHGIISNEDINRLMQLSRDCDCWIYFDDTEEETAIDLITWKRRFEETIVDGP